MTSVSHTRHHKFLFFLTQITDIVMKFRQYPNSTTDLLDFDVASGTANEARTISIHFYLEDSGHTVPSPPPQVIPSPDELSQELIAQPLYASIIPEDPGTSSRLFKVTSTTCINMRKCSTFYSRSTRQPIMLTHFFSLKQTSSVYDQTMGIRTYHYAISW